MARVENDRFLNGDSTLQSSAKRALQHYHYTAAGIGDGNSHMMPKGGGEQENDDGPSFRSKHSVRIRNHIHRNFGKGASSPWEEHFQQNDPHLHSPWNQDSPAMSTDHHNNDDHFDQNVMMAGGGNNNIYTSNRNDSTISDGSWQICVLVLLGIIVALWRLFVNSINNHHHHSMVESEKPLLKKTTSTSLSPSSLCNNQNSPLRPGVRRRPVPTSVPQSPMAFVPQSNQPFGENDPLVDKTPKSRCGKNRVRLGVPSSFVVSDIPNPPIPFPRKALDNCPNNDNNNTAIEEKNHDTSPGKTDEAPHPLFPDGNGLLPLIPPLDNGKKEAGMSTSKPNQGSQQVQEQEEAAPSHLSTEGSRLNKMELGVKNEDGVPDKGSEDVFRKLAIIYQPSPKKEQQTTPPIISPSSVGGATPVQHARPDVTVGSDPTSSFNSLINFSTEIKLKKVIGGGGFGQVWEATWKGTPVAVKVLNGSAQKYDAPKSILEEFVSEINMLSGLHHPNICLYLGACIDPPNRAIVTELAAHGSLWDALRQPLDAPYEAADGKTRSSWPISLYRSKQKQGRSLVRDNDDGWYEGSNLTSGEPLFAPPGTWPWHLVKKVARGAACAMAHLHSGNPPILHRDLKSANVLLDGSYEAKIADFGLSRSKAIDLSMTMTRNCGTVQWMAPEILCNLKYGEPADVYSFGIILWELLTRECPYKDMEGFQCVLEVVNKNIRPEIPNWCPPALKALIKSCLEREPSDRPTFPQIILAFDAMP